MSIFNWHVNHQMCTFQHVTGTYLRYVDKCINFDFSTRTFLNSSWRHLRLGIITFNIISPGWGSALTLILGVAADCCLLYSAAYTKASTKSRSITALIYIACLLLSAIFQVIWFILMMKVLAEGNGFSSILLPITAPWMAINCIRLSTIWYFCLIAYSFYKELNCKIVATKKVDPKTYHVYNYIHFTKDIDQNESCLQTSFATIHSHIDTNA